MQPLQRFPRRGTKSWSQSLFLSVFSRKRKNKKLPRSAPCSTQDQGAHTETFKTRVWTVWNPCLCYKAMEFSTATNGLIKKKGLKNGGHQETVFTAREWNQITEQVNVRQPLEETTDFRLEERNVITSAVVPYILSLNHHLLYQKNVKQQQKSLHYLDGWIPKESLQKRSSGIFLLMKGWLRMRVMRQLSTSTPQSCFARSFIWHHVVDPRCFGHQKQPRRLPLSW